MNKKYIAYFQRVTTLGIVTSGERIEEAQEKAERLIKQQDAPQCFFDETTWELVDMEEKKS